MMHSQSKPQVALVVEDEPLLRELAAALLEEFPFRVVEVESAEEALAYLQQHGAEVAFIFADVRLSGSMDGVQFAKATCKLWPTVKVVLTTGDPDVVLEDLPACVTFISKPWRALDVLIQAESAVRHPQPAVT